MKKILPYAVFANLCYLGPLRKREGNIFDELRTKSGISKRKVVSRNFQRLFLKVLYFFNNMWDISN